MTYAIDTVIDVIVTGSADVSFLADLMGHPKTVPVALSTVILTTKLCNIFTCVYKGLDI